MTQIERLAEQFDGFRKLVGGLAFISEPSSAATSSTEFAPMLMAMRFCEPMRVDGERERRDCAVDGGFFEQQRLAAVRRFHFAVGDFGDFEFGGDGLGNALEFAGAVELPDKIAEGIKSHTRARLSRITAKAQMNIARVTDATAAGIRVSICGYCGENYFGSKSATSAFVLPSIRSRWRQFSRG